MKKRPLCLKNFSGSFMAVFIIGKSKDIYKFLRLSNRDIVETACSTSLLRTNFFKSPKDFEIEINISQTFRYDIFYTFSSVFSST